MSRCPTCRVEFDKGEQFCPRDGSPLSDVPAAGGDPYEGRVLGGRYRLTSRLGQGGMGTVYRAVHTLMDKPVAVKILRGELSTDAEAVARFHREARSASRLDHDHCIRVSDFGQSEDGLLYLAMELLEGRSLGERMKAGPIPIGEAARIAHSVTLALEHAHEAGVVHRDLKPDNVFLARRSRGRELVKVLDFGLAKLASDSGKSRSITRDGTIFGTPEYMAPEQAQGDPLDTRTDLYSLGVLLYHLLTGVLPFQADTFVALLTKHVRETPKPPREILPELPVELETIVLTCMQKRPQDRYASATAVAEALLPYAARGDVTGPTATVRPSGAVAASGTASAAATESAADSAADPVSAAGSIVGESGWFARDVAPRPRRWPAIAGGVLALAAIGWTGQSLLRDRRPTVVVADPALGDVRRLTDANQLDEAASRLEVLHRQGESPALERMTAEVAERRGRRLEALAHLHRAKTLAPNDPAIREALASLLLRLGHAPEACHQAARAAELATASGDAATIASAQGILKRAACAP